ncbi:hypothetical protein [Aggregatibacter aphrophilus]|uniref:hypothetical protein n=1 Tax=Aggregatibacter aphrophilus TaxID=732 RepID=UPI00067FBB44|nr:hypothetical protein [Aggregatibacter aphrophilus]
MLAEVPASVAEDADLSADVLAARADPLAELAALTALLAAVSILPKFSVTVDAADEAAEMDCFAVEDKP